jgi:hypothetical protein
MSLEKEIQSKVIKELERYGWYCIKIIQTNKNGIPDLVCHKQGRTMYIELKRPGLKPTPLQDVRHKELRRAGMNVHVVRYVDDLYLYGLINALDEPTKDSRNSAKIPWADGEIWEPRMD